MKNSSIGLIIKIFSGIIFCFSFITGFFSEEQLLLTWIIGLTSGIFVFAFGEIIDLLQGIYTSNKAIYIRLDKFNKDDK